MQNISDERFLGGIWAAKLAKLLRRDHIQEFLWQFKTLLVSLCLELYSKRREVSGQTTRVDELSRVGFERSQSNQFELQSRVGVSM